MGQTPEEDVRVYHRNNKGNEYDPKESIQIHRIHKIITMLYLKYNQEIKEW